MTRRVGVFAMPPAGYAYAPMALLRSCRVIHPKQQIIVQASEISKGIVTNSTLEVNEVHPLNLKSAV